MKCPRFPAAAIVLLGLTCAGTSFAQTTVDDGDSDEMAEARETLRQEHGGATTTMLLGERLEYGFDDDQRYLWDLQGWTGGDLSRLWIKSEGEYSSDSEQFESAEIQALYSRAISRYFDLQVGVRHDFEPGPSRSHLVLGAQGLAPYWFELDTVLFLSEDGDLTARVEAEYDVLLTQRLIAQPRAELELAARDVPELGIGSGLSAVELDLRLRYEMRREFAPYLGLSWEKLVGDTSDFARAAGEPTNSLFLVIGLRFWY